MSINEPTSTPHEHRRGTADARRRRDTTLGVWWSAVASSPTRLAGFIITASFIVLALLAPTIAPHSPFYMSDGLELAPPTWSHPFGTDELGRDVMSRVIFGARISLMVGFGGVLGATLLGVALGLIAGYAGPGSVTDSIVMRVMDTLLAFPTILIGIIVIVVLGTSTVNVAIAVAVSNLPLMARLLRAEVLRERQREYVMAAGALGAGSARIMVRHVLPNTTGVIIVQVATSLGAAILLEAALSFLGLGAQPPEPSWGAMLRDARSYLRPAPWYAIAPGASLTLLIIGVNYFSDALRILAARRAT